VFCPGKHLSFGTGHAAPLAIPITLGGVMRCSSDDLRSLSKNALLDAKINRMSRSSNLRKHIAELKEELSDVRSELAEIEHLIKITHIVNFPAPVVEAKTKVPYERWPSVAAVEKKKSA
jgi:hypothetical protein